MTACGPPSSLPPPGVLGDLGYADSPSWCLLPAVTAFAWHIREVSFIYVLSKQLVVPLACFESTWLGEGHGLGQSSWAITDPEPAGAGRENSFHRSLPTQHTEQGFVALCGHQDMPAAC